ncbi:hypothetical protein PMI13_02422 [Chryseobacterium populi]|uniref:Uncharacterized protein n=1 Tax=Chryseobacterium populi TaxID=1144316 RepID=J2SZW9_9FLAO|nr:hypothetical protein PMI13_02422 [Chryseobacterium populi]
MPCSCCFLTFQSLLWDSVSHYYILNKVSLLISFFIHFSSTENSFSSTSCNRLLFSTAFLRLFSISESSELFVTVLIFLTPAFRQAHQLTGFQKLVMGFYRTYIIVLGVPALVIILARFALGGAPDSGFPQWHFNTPRNGISSSITVLVFSGVSFSPVPLSKWFCQRWLRICRQTIRLHNPYRLNPA